MSDAATERLDWICACMHECGGLPMPVSRATYSRHRPFREQDKDDLFADFDREYPRSEGTKPKAKQKGKKRARVESGDVRGTQSAVSAFNSRFFEQERPGPSSRGPVQGQNHSDIGEDHDITMVEPDLSEPQDDLVTQSVCQNSPAVTRPISPAQDIPATQPVPTTIGTPGDSNEPFSGVLPFFSYTTSLLNAMRKAEFEDDIDDPSALYSLEHPEPMPVDLEPLEELSLNIFLALSDGSQKMYNGVRDALRHHNKKLKLLSHYKVKSLINNRTGLVQVRHDMCPNGCTAFTGEYSKKDSCPTCGEPRHAIGKNGKAEPRLQFTTIPLGPQLQAQFRSPEGAHRMRYRNRKTEEVQDSLRDTNGRLKTIDDFFCGQQYLDAVADGEIQENDILVMLSINDAQLYQDKESHCWVFVWIILNLSPDIRYQKKYILPAGFVPGPKKGKNVESYLLPSLRHLGALQRKGLKVWDGNVQGEIDCRVLFARGTADFVAFPILSGRVPHNGYYSCRHQCPEHGRNKPGQGVYYPAALRPSDAPHDYPKDGDIDTRKIASGKSSANNGRSNDEVMEIMVLMDCPPLVPLFWVH